MQKSQNVCTLLPYLMHKTLQGKKLAPELSRSLTLASSTESKEAAGDFPGGTAVENLPANAGDMGSSPGRGSSHMPRSNSARAPQLLKPVCLEPVLRNNRGHCNERLTQHSEE